MPLKNHRFGAVDDTADNVPPVTVRCGVNELQVGLAQVDSTAEPPKATVPPPEVKGDANERVSPRVDPTKTGTVETPLNVVLAVGFAYGAAEV
jgi:hypothetical protein